MKVMLVFPPTTIYGDDPSVPPVVQPLGLAYLGAYLEQEGHEVYDELFRQEVSQ